LPARTILESIINRLAARLALALLACACLPWSQAGELALDARLNEQIIMVPAGRAQTVELETTVFRPPGPGPFPLLIVNHGKAPGNPKLQARDRFIYFATAFVRRGYAVMVPMRTGFANSTGKFVEYGCNMTANGYEQAGDIADVVRYARTLPWVDSERIVLAGQSFGGLASVAAATQDLPGVRGIINFAGGLKVHGDTCDWQRALVKAFAEYGRRNKLPSMWMYGANDSYFGPALAARMHAAFTAAGGKAELVAYGPFKKDAHGLLGNRDGAAVWLPEVERFLGALGMPTREVFAVAEPPAQRATHYAALDDIDAVPYVPLRGREQYREFLKKATPRAFAISSSGSWGWAEEGENTNEKALAACQAASTEPCQLYSVDHDIVWSERGTAGRN
jgi:dienelactone hydrolase